jgi:Fe-S cluster assembly protein SufD
VTLERDTFRRNHETRLQRQGTAGWSDALGRAALARFLDSGFPTTREEEWRYTNVAAFASMPFGLPVRHELSGEERQSLMALAPAFADDFEDRRMVFVNGRFAPALSHLGRPAPGLRLSSLAGSLSADAAALEPVLNRAAGESGFRVLNTAFLGDGAFIRLDDGAVVKEPIHLVHIAVGDGSPSATVLRHVVLAGAGSRATLVETHLGLGSQACLTSVVAQAVLGESSRLELHRLQQEGLSSLHVGEWLVRQERDSEFRSLSVALGAAVSRHDIFAELAGEGARCTLDGLYLGFGRQVVDNHTFVDHAVPRCTSSEDYKGILDGSARGVFAGRVLVRQSAVHTDARQSNRSLLLTEEAESDTKPQLEIYADDVKCSHGAAVGQLDPDALFYLRSRGLNQGEARAMLTLAFAGELLGRVEHEPLRLHLDGLLRRWLARGGQA